MTRPPAVKNSGVQPGSVEGATKISPGSRCAPTGSSMTRARAVTVPVEAVVYPRQDELTAAVINGEIDAMSADSPVTGFAIKGSGGALAPAGEQFDTAPYGWPVAKDSGLAE